MPLGKYHCDYCDKEFQDTPVARKRHLLSSSHLRAKSIWYNSFPPSSAASNAPPPPPTGLCNRFVKTGFCPYGDSCKYSHLSSNTATPQNYNSAQDLSVPGLVAAAGSLSSSFQSGPSSVHVMPNSMGGWWGNLPPSLMPPPEGGYRSDLPYLDWG